MLLGWQRLALGGKLGKATTDAEAGIARLDYIVDIAILRCLVRSCEQVVVRFLLLGEECLYVLSSLLLCLGFLGTEHCNGTRGSHNGNLG